MIDYQAIREYFDKEAETAKEHWSQSMSLSVKERVRKRKAIFPVFIDREFSHNPDNGNRLRKVHFATNLSDFKEGDSLLLHREGICEGIECTLWRFEGENDIIVDIYCEPVAMDSYYDTPLVLDKNYVDLRPNVYHYFLYELPNEWDYWEKSIINTRTSPEFEEREKNLEELEDTIKNYKLDLTPRQKEAIFNSMCAKDYYLIQGPPGTGKSFVLGLIILEELLYFRRKVAVIGPNHMAINNVLGQVLTLLPYAVNCIIKIGQSYNAPTTTVTTEDGDFSISNIPYLNVEGANELEGPLLYGLTPHSLYTRRAQSLQFDTLIIDEAGQMTVPLALMGMRCAKKVILAGDHKQLPPIINTDNINPALNSSIFQTLISQENCTMLDISFRMCEPICEFVSKLFYDNEVKPKRLGREKIVENDNGLYSFSTPLFFLDVDDQGEQVSEKEATAIADAICGFMQRNYPAKSIAVLSPFRAQAAAIRRELRRRNDTLSDDVLSVLTVDTVDKMQGQEREVIFFSFTSGDQEYIKEMGDFLYSPNKLNVAFSRAKSKLILVGNKKALEAVDSTAYPHIARMFQLLKESGAHHFE